MLWRTNKPLEKLRSCLAVEGADDEGEKAYHVGGRLCSGVAFFRALLMSGVGNPLRASLYTADAGADFMEANEHCQSIDIADESF
jgi:hypothetical protein